MNKKIKLTILTAITLFSSISFALSNQPYAVDRVYYSDSSKSVTVGLSHIPCPTYHGVGEQLDGQKTNHYTEIQVARCDGGPAAGRGRY